MATVGGVVALLHIVGWGVLVIGVGLGVTAYLLGVRHAFDADHIAVIDWSTQT